MNSRTISNRGFTIVELLIVVVVIAILAAIVIVAYNGIQSRAKQSAAQTSVKQVATKIQSYVVENGSGYPASLTAIGVADSPTTIYTYTVDNNASPATYCISANVSGTHYYMSNTVTSPTSGECTSSSNPSPTTSSVFGATYPYSATLYNDAGGSLKVATLFYTNNGPFNITGGRVYLPSVPAGVSLTIFYVRGFYSGSVIARPDWNAIPSGIPGQFATIPNSSLVTGWNEVTFPTPGQINTYDRGVGQTAVWVGYYFSDGNHYVFTPSPVTSSIQSTTQPRLSLAEQTFEGSASRSAYSISGGGWQTGLYGIDILTTW